MNRFSVIAAALLSAGWLINASAISRAAAPTPAATPLAGFSARGTLSVALNLAKMPSPLGISAEIAVMSKARRLRVDLLRFASTTTEKGSSDMVNQFLPTGALSVVYNQDTHTFAMWSEQKREYYQSKNTPASKTKPALKPNATASPLQQVMKALRSFTEYDSFNETLSLVGHQLVNGHTSSVFHMSVQSQKHGGKPLDMSSDVAFADDLAGIPVHVLLTSRGEYDGTLKLDLSSASTAVPDVSVFNVPAGYRKVASIMELFIKAP